MTRKEYKEIASHFSSYQGKEVEYRYFIPSAHRFGKARGRIHGICRDNLIIASAGHTHMIYYTDATLI